MKTLATDFLLKENPTAIAIVDTKLNFISYSNQWLSDFTNNKIDVEGQYLFDIINEMPILFKTAIEIALKGKEDINNGRKFILPCGQVQWLKWKISPMRNDENSIDGLLIFIEDISKDKRDLELLQKAESVAKIGGWEVDLQKQTVYWTKTTKDIHEVDEDFVPNLEQGINFYKEGIHREKITKLVGSAIEQGKPWDTELIIVTAKGNDLWVRAIGEPEMFDNKVVRIIGTFQDIDERKKIELALEEISELLKLATQTVQIGIWEYDLIKNKLVWDSAMYKIFGVDKNQFSGVFEAWKSTIHPDDKEKALKATNDAIIGIKDFDEEFRIKLPNGQVKYIKGLSKTIRNLKGTAIKMTGANWDITELSSTKLQLERNEESFIDSFKNSATGMALVSTNGTWIKVNTSLCKSLGYSEKELLKLTLLDITYPEDLHLGLDLLNEVIDNKRESFQIEKRYYHKKGHLVYAILTVTVVRNINGDISHFWSQILDITERIETEKRLETLVEVTKSQNDSLMNFAHIVSHNLRSHSTNMTMLAKFLSEEEDKKELKNINRMISDAAHGLSETITHLNEVVQVKTGALENLQSISVLNTIEHIKKSIGGLLEEQGAVVKINIEKSHFVNAVPAYLESIFLNILTNSLKYSSPDRTPIIEIKSKLKKDTVIITFKDNGQGIDLKRHGDKIFGMYKTFHKHKDAKGIGLFITKNQIEAMSGSINIESVVDEGTTIFIELKQS